MKAGIVQINKSMAFIDTSFMVAWPAYWLLGAVAAIMKIRECL